MNRYEYRLHWLKKVQRAQRSARNMKIIFLISVFFILAAILVWDSF